MASINRRNAQAISRTCSITKTLKIGVKAAYHVNADVVETIFQGDYDTLSDIMYLLEHCCLKTNIESIVESAGSVLKKHLQPDRLTVENISISTSNQF